MNNTQTKNVSLILPVEMDEFLRKIASERLTSKSAVIREVLAKHLNSKVGNK